MENIDNPMTDRITTADTPPQADNAPQTPIQQPPAHGSAWEPLRQPLFRVIWIAAFVSNIGTWMQNVAAGWLMTSLSSLPLMVALVQAASSLAFCLLALPAGAVADVVDRRRLLLITQGWMLLAAAALGALTLAGATTAWILIAFTFLLGMGAAMTGPAWMAIIPELVPRRQMPAAVVLNSVGFNLALAVGPALGGLVVAAVGEGQEGAGIAFVLNAVSFLGVMVVLYRWRRPQFDSMLPTERVVGAMRAGVRYVRHAPELQAVFIRGTAFILCASALWALLPQLVRHVLQRDSGDYGILLGFLGVGSVGGAAVMPRVRHRVGIDSLVAGATALFAGVLVTLAYVPLFPVLCAAMVLAGVAWLCVTGTLMVAAQTMVPSWVRARALAIFMVVFQAGMAGGSALWGGVADWVTTPKSFACAAVGLLLGTLLMLRYRLVSGEERDMAPALHWPGHSGENEPDHEHGPVLIVVEYHVDPARAQDFALAMRPVRLCRLRDGAMRWGLFHATVDPSRYIETFIVESWIEHLRQHERMTNEDRLAEERARAFHIGPQPPVVSHYVAATTQ